MHILPDQFYHIYNQGNNQQLVFSDHEDCMNFLKRVKRHISPVCDILAYCLMPNHFHFLVITNETSAEALPLGNIEITRLSNAFRLLASQYVLDYNKKHNRSGSLFRQKTKAKLLPDHEQAFICFQYIHQNPVKADLVNKMEHYEYSSFNDYAKRRNGTLCNRELAAQYLGLDSNNFIKQSYGVAINEKVTKSIFL